MTTNQNLAAKNGDANTHDGSSKDDPLERLTEALRDLIKAREPVTITTISPPKNEPELEPEPEAPEVSTAGVQPKKAKKRERRTLLYPNHYSLRIREEDRERFDEYAYRHRLEKGAAFKRLLDITEAWEASQED